MSSNRHIGWWLVDIGVQVRLWTRVTLVLVRLVGNDGSRISRVYVRVLTVGGCLFAATVSP